MTGSGETDASTIRRLGPYELLGVLGQGAAGVVYRARDPQTGQEVALKTCVSAGPGRAESLRREILALRRLDHPGVVRMLAEGVADGVPWLAMELLRGRTLRERFSEVHAAPAPRAPGSRLEDLLVLIARLCEPLSYLHQHGVVHGDLKPENVHLSANDAPVLVDFGFHRRGSDVRGREGLEVGGVVRGTYCYMAPEQIWGELIDARADLYALGCLMYEAVTGVPPFVGTLNEVFQKHLHRAPDRPSTRAPGIPEWLDVLVMQLLAKRRRDRLGYADLVARRIVAHVPERALPPPPVAHSYVYRPDLVGREDLVATLTATLVAARGGRGSVTLMVGESGIGKTRLAMEIGTIAVRRRMDVLLGECETAAGESAVLSRTALQPFRPFLAHVADRCWTGGPEATQSLLGTRGSVLAAYEPSLANLSGVSGPASVPEVSPEAARERLTRAMCETLAAVAADRPLLLILDDVQWADELSMSVLEALALRSLDGVPIAVIATCRAEEVDGPLRALIERSRSVVRVERLRGDGVDRMVADMLALPAPAAEFTRALFEHTEGNPFYVSAYVLVAVEQGYLRRDGSGAWQLARPREVGHAAYTLPIPRTLQDLVRLRLERLPSAFRRVVEIGSALGMAFEEAVLLHAVDLPETTAMAAIDELLFRQILQRDQPGTLAFAHAKIREVTYDAVAPAARIVMHERAAHAIEARCSDPAKRPAYYGALALHWSRVAAARVHDRVVRATALAALEAAGRQAVEANDHQQAVRMFAEAVRLDGAGRDTERVPNARRALWHQQLGDSHFRLGHMREARDELATALGLAGSRVPSGAVAMAIGLSGAIATQARRRLRADHHGPLPSSTVDELDQARTYDLLSFVQFLLMERTPSLVSSLRSLNRAEALAPSSALVNSSAMIGTVAGTLIGARLARRYFDMALANARRLGDDLALGRAAEMQGFYLIGQGRWSAAAASLLEAIAAFERIEDRPWRAIAVLTFANLHYMQHRPAQQYYADGLRSGAERGDAQCVAWAELGQASQLIQRGEHAAGLAMLDASSDGRPMAQRFEELSDVTSQLITWGARALGLYRLGAHEAAIDAIVAACALLPQAPLFRYDPLPGYVLTADVAARLWETARAEGSPRERQLAHLAATTFRHLRAFSRFIPIARPHAAVTHGLLLWVRRSPRRALAEWRRAIRLATRLSMPYERALACFEIARHGSDDEAHACLGESLAAFEELGMRFECDLVRSVGATNPTRPSPSAGGR